MRFFYDSRYRQLFRASANLGDVARWDAGTQSWTPVDRLWFTDRIYGYDPDATVEGRPPYYSPDIDLDEVTEARAQELMT